MEIMLNSIFFASTRVIIEVYSMSMTNTILAFMVITRSLGVWGASSMYQISLNQALMI